MSEKTSVSARVDRDLMDRFERQLSDDQSKSEIIREYIEHIADEGHAERSPFDAQINECRRQKREIRRQIEMLEQKQEEVIDKLERLERKRSQYEDSTERLEGRLEAMDTQLRHNGMNIHKRCSAVKDVARDYGKTEGEIVEMMKRRNPDVPSHAFTHTDDPSTIGVWNGFNDPEIADRGLEERTDERN